MGDWGIKVSKPGFDVKTAADKDLVFSSKFQTLHIHSRGSGTVTDSGGRTITIAHNLGYVPKFLVHTQMDAATGYGDSNSYFIAPYSVEGAGIDQNRLDRGVTSWADSTNLYIKYGDGFGYLEFGTDLDSNNYGWDSDGSSYSSGATLVGHDPVFGDQFGAFRFVDVSVAQGASIYKANLGFYVSASDPGDVSTTIYGIDEDNTADFAGSPFGRPTTSASGNETYSSSIGVNAIWQTGVTSQVQEIINRGGWSSGNAMGFILLNNGTTGDKHIEDTGAGFTSTSYSYLSVLLSNTLASYKYTIFLDKIIP